MSDDWSFWSSDEFNGRSERQLLLASQPCQISAGPNLPDNLNLLDDAALRNRNSATKHKHIPE